MPYYQSPTKKIEGYQLGRVLGVGGFGKVVLGVDTKTFKKVAVKIISKEVVRAHHLEDYVKREIAMLRQVNHPHVVKLFQVLDDNLCYYLIMELAPNGELFDRILTAQRFEEGVARQYFQELISAVWACHELGIVHRDLKAENLLVGEQGSLKVCDFGLSRYVYEAQRVSDHPVVFTSLAGSLDYQSPEMLEGHYNGYSNDIWACGVILFFMLCGYLPFACTNESSTRSRIKTAAFNNQEPHLSPGALDLIKGILVVDEKKRLTLQGIVAHPWFRVKLPREMFPEEVSSPSQVFPGMVHSGSFSRNSPSPLPMHNNSFPERRSSEIDSVKLVELAFESCNVDGTGYLDRDQLRDVLIKLNNGEPVPDTEVQNMMQALSFDPQTGKLSRLDFIKTMLENKTLEGKLQLGRLINVFHYEIERELLTELRRAFDALDADHSGVITVKNLRTVNELSNLQLSDAEVEQMMSAFKSKKSGITFEQFVQSVSRGDFLQSHPVARKLQRIADIFAAQDFHCNTLINTGFTVAAFREELERKLFEEGKGKELNTVFSFQPESLFLAGVHTDPNGQQIEVGMQLQPITIGYTKIFVYRIKGQTEVFHNWFRKLRRVLQQEILQCEDDLAARGESELM